MPGWCVDAPRGIEASGGPAKRAGRPVTSALGAIGAVLLGVGCLVAGAWLSWTYTGLRPSGAGRASPSWRRGVVWPLAIAAATVLALVVAAGPTRAFLTLAAGVSLGTLVAVAHPRRAG